SLVRDCRNGQFGCKQEVITITTFHRQTPFFASTFLLYDASMVARPNYVYYVEASQKRAQALEYSRHLYHCRSTALYFGVPCIHPQGFVFFWNCIVGQICLGSAGVVQQEEGVCWRGCPGSHASTHPPAFIAGRSPASFEFDSIIWQA